MISQELSKNIIRQKKTMIRLHYEFENMYDARLNHKMLHRIRFILPMKKINEVPVFCELKYYRHPSGQSAWKFQIENIYDETPLYEKDVALYRESHYMGYAMAIKKIKAIVPRLVFNKVTSEFNDASKPSMECLLMEEMSGLKNCDTYHNTTCVVCYDNTNNKTPCEHMLCVPCWSKLDENARKCPICRLCFRCKEPEDDCECCDED
jgi:hypothetical protein